MSQFKELFGSTFTNIVNLKAGLQCKEISDAHNEFLIRQDGVKFDIWKDMAKILKVSPKKIHDYYHNTWSKQFSDDINPYRDEIKSLIQMTQFSHSIQETVKHAITELKKLYPKLNLHYQTVYQYVNYQVKNNLKNLPAIPTCFVVKQEESSETKEDRKPSSQQITELFDTFEHTALPFYESLFPIADFDAL
ncbi:Conserved_hypothetical protein [Hexamita inflata]|uniref:Uncharacterized protein n=1 Tax=Hexamita inflata TaxID=28002 RepID=A0ABP1IAR0_9EUKA